MHLYCSIDGQINTYLKNILKRKKNIRLVICNHHCLNQYQI